MQNLSFFDKIGGLNVLGVFTVSVAFFGIFATFSKFSETERKSKNLSLSHKKPKIWTCLEVPLFRSHSTVICYIYQYLKTWKKIQNKSLFQKKPTQNLTVLSILTFFGHIPLHSCYLQQLVKKSCFIFKKSIFF